MKRLFLHSVLVGTCLFLSGCVSVDVDQKEIDYMVLPKKSLVPFEKLTIGMSRNEVQETLGDDVVIGYEKNEKNEGWTELVLNQPHRQETIQISGGQEYVITYYFSRVFKEDGVVSNEELVPLIFLDEKLKAVGWFELDKLKERALQVF